ncbi:hypothetical protein LUZ60_007814 [Juncus effusus]|nr:hypothetical protein LUZ60_007814 [Juncus effusus]
MARVRLRLLFSDRGLLTKNQRADGLRRCWLLLRPEMRTVGELASVVYRRFNLRRTCPHGIFFTMDGFVVPSFESTCIFLDKDLVRVHKLSKKKKLISGRNEDQPTEILAVESREEIEEENAAQNETLYLEDKKKSKRKLKDLEKPECSKKKKRQKLNKTPEKPLIIQENSENVVEEQSQDSESNKSIHEDQNEDLENNENTHEVQNEDSETTAHTSSDNETEKSSPVEQGRKIPLEVSRDERSSPDANVGLSPVETERNNQMEVPSHEYNENRTQINARHARKKLRRSRRRRKAQRELKRELKNLAIEKKQSALLRNEIPSSSNQEIAWKDSREIAEKEIIEKPSVVVPVVVRPGHIRFESDDDDAGPSKKQQNVSTNEQFNLPTENFQWNGITKAKGQKWGQGSKRKNDSFNESNWTSSNWQNENNNNENNMQAKEKYTTENGKGKAITKDLNLESLCALTRAPKEGDIIVYQVVELSPITFCPEVSSHRVGEVKMYDPILNKIILTPVPEYPIFPEKNENDLDNENEDETLDLADLSIYKEDGSLEIEFSALLDLRLLKEKENNSESASASSLSRKSKNKSTIIINNNNSWENNASVNNAPNYNNNNWNESNSYQQNNNNLETESNNIPTGTGENQTEQNGWEKWAPNTSTPSWSYHALRGSALGPTIALLRGNDNNNCANNSTRENCRGRGRGRKGIGAGRRDRGY